MPEIIIVKNEAEAGEIYGRCVADLIKAKPDAVLGLALANQILSACGKPLLPIDSAQLEQWVTAGLTSAAAIWAWWENNSFTKEALAADSYLEQLKKSVH